MMKTQDGELFVISGASRSGKTWWTVKAASTAVRVMVWDPEDQWSKLRGFKRITTREGLLLAATTPGKGKIAFVAGGNLAADFDFFCRAAMYWGRWHGPCNVVAEELADVSTPSKAPGNWGILLRRGLKRGITIYAISQRWAEADKTAIGNATRFVVFRANGDDAAYIARKAGLNLTEVNGMPPLQYIAKDATNGNTRKGKMR